MKRLILLLMLGLLAVTSVVVDAQVGRGSNGTAVRSQKVKSSFGKFGVTRRHRLHPTAKWSRTAKTALPAAQVSSLTIPTYTPQKFDMPYAPHLTAVDPYANAANSADGLKPARPFWYSVDTGGLSIWGIDDNRLIYRVPWPATYWLALPDGEFEVVPAPAGGWEPVGMTVTYPTEEALASNSETPPTFVYVVMAHSGYQWESETDQAILAAELRDPNLRDKIVPTTDPATESSLLISVDVSDPTFDPESAPMGPVVAGNILGHYAGQPAYDPGTDTLYIGNMPSTSLAANLQSFVSVISAPAPPVPELAGGGPAAPEIPMVNMCGPEHPDEGLLIGEPYVWPCTESGDGPAVWEFQGLPSWMFAHADKRTGDLDGLLYGMPPANGTWTFQARVTDYGDTELGPQTSDWTTWTVMVSDTGVASEAEAGFEAGVPGGLGVGGTGTCEPAGVNGSLVPAWIDVQPAMLNGAVRGCYVMGTAPISGEYHEFTLPNFHFIYPFDREPVLFVGNVVGPYMFDPLPAGVGLSGLAWHQVEKIHDPSTEADILNSEFIGVERFTGQMYRIVPPQGSIEVGTVIGPPETSMELDTVEKVDMPPLTETLKSARADIAAQFTGTQVIAFGDLVVEADRDIFASATFVLDPVSGTSLPIGGPAGSTIENGALLKVSGGAASTIELPGLQAYYLALNSNLAPGIPGVEPGQVDHGMLWVTGTNTGNAAVVDTANTAVNQTFAVEGATSLGGVGVDTGFGYAYVAGESLNSVIIFGDGTTRAPRAPVIWSAALTTFNVGETNSFTVMATGSPTAELSYSGALPSGVIFKDNGDGTATLGGTPAADTSGDYTITFVAANGVSPDANQTFVLSIAAAPVFISADNTTFVAGELGSFMVATTGSPTLTTMWCGDSTGGVSCVYPSWLSFVDNEDGTSSFTGTPPAEEVGKSYQFTLWATTGVAPDATQLFTLNVVAPGASYKPSVSTQPLNQTVTEGETATFSAAASGWPTPTVQWEVSTDGLNYAPITGAVNASLTTAATTMSMNGYRFRAVFTNDQGSAATTGALLTVNSLSAPSMTLNPSNATVTAGQTATFTAAASGSPTPTVQWQLSMDLGVSWANIGGATAASYTTQSTTISMSGYRYRAVFTNASGTVASSAAALTVNPAQTAPSIALQPFAQTVTVGQSATFAAAADGNPTPTVQWQISLDSGATWSNIAGAVATSYATPSATVAMSGYRYRAVFTNVVGSATTNAAVLTVNAAPAVTTNPSNQTVLVDQTGTFTAAASGNPRPTVQWQLSTNGGSTWSNIGGATNTTYTTGSTTLAMNGYRYHAVFTNVLGSVTTTAATLTVQQAPAITSANTTTFAVGQAGTFTVTTTGSPAPSLTPWGNLPNGVTFTDNGNGTGTLAGTPASGSLTSYQFTITAANGVPPNAIQNFTLTVNVPQGTAPAITSADTTTFTVGNAGSFRVTATGTPSPSVSAFGTFPAGVTFTNGTGSGTLAGTPAAGTQGSYQFVVRATNGVGSDAYQYFTLVVNPGTVQPLAIATTSLPQGRTGQPYAAQLQATGGTQPYAWSLASGSLPRGLTLSQSGVISGTPTRTGNSTFTVRVTDAQSRTTTRSLSLRIR